MTIDQDTYIKERVDDQLSWYESKSSTNKNMYRRLAILEMSIALCIPFLTSYIDDLHPTLKYAVGILGVSIGLIAGLNTLMKYQENWVEYRTTAENLKQEKYLFMTKTGEYGKSDAFQRFVLRIEGILSKENSQWGNYIVAPEDAHEEQM